MYVIRTLRAFFHIGSVLWVTVQVPRSQESVGGGIVAVLRVGEVEGVRRVIRGVAGWVVAGSVGAVVVVVAEVGVVMAEAWSAVWVTGGAASGAGVAIVKV